MLSVWPFWIEKSGDSHRDYDDVHREHDDFHGEKMVAVILELLATFLWIILGLSFHWLFVSP